MMAKSKAQRMREYRERKKAELGEEWLRRENRRVKSYFVPVSQLSREKTAKRRERNRRNAQSYRVKKQKKFSEDKNCNVAEVNHAGASTSRDDENGVSSTTSDILNSPLIVKMPAMKSHSSAGKKRTSRALAKAYREIEKLSDQKKDLSRKLNTTRKRLSRSEEKKKPMTPNSKTDKLLKEAGVSPRRGKELRKKLLYAECLSEEIKEAKRRNPRKLREINVVVSGKLIKKYRLKSQLEKSANISRKYGHVHSKHMLKFRKSREEIKRTKLKNMIHEFLERDDNSRLLPGKADAVKDGKGSKDKKQKRVLNDYLHNLHLKFFSETGCAVSLATFCRYRPHHICLVNFTSRSTCLCPKHQNFCLKLRALKLLKVNSCTSPDKFIEIFPDETQLDTVLSKIPEDTVKFQEWKRVKCRDGKERMKVVDTELDKTEFIKVMKSAHSDFVEHVRKVKEQYSAIKEMKEKLPEKHAIIQMDFAENYGCASVEEITSAYWNSTMVTLHPAIVYYKATDETLQHISTVFVSEVLSHNSAMVYAIIKNLMSVLSTRLPNLEYIHFWTDSPTSQYRNKTMFDLVSRFETLYGMRASWHFFEAGHGKGPCDGVGGTTKRNADNAVKQGKVIIQDASDFYAWAISTDTQIEYYYVANEEFEKNRAEVESKTKQLKPIKGTFELHAIVGVSDGKVLARKTTCACSECFSDEGFNSSSSCTWQQHTVSINETGKGRDSVGNADLGEVQNETLSAEVVEDEVLPVNVVKGNFAIVLYDEICYVGKVIEVDDEDDTFHVSFMENCVKMEGRYRWPKPEDKLWVPKSDVLKCIEEPTATGKTRRIFSVGEDVLSFIQNFHPKSN